MKRAILTLISVCIFSVAAAQNVHVVVAEKPLYLTDGQTGLHYEKLKGSCSINWKDITRYGFFNAKIKVFDSPVPLFYEFQLVSMGNSSNTMIEGLFDIKRNGILVAPGIVGRLYGIDSPIGAYFKFYGGDSSCYDEKWHVSAFITQRVDY